MSNTSTIGLTANLMRMVNLEARPDNREALIQYLLAEDGAVELTEHQQKLLERVQEADRMMRTGRYKQTEIEHLLAKKFNYSRDTARNDIAAAESIYGSSRRRNKSYLLSNHIDFIDTCIRKLFAAGCIKEAVQLIGEKTKAIKELPDYSTSDTTPAAIIFNIDASTNVNISKIAMDDDKARTVALGFLKKQDITDIEEDEI